MRVSTLNLVNYRNYEKLLLELSPGINVFLGMNAQGKTNIIEAVYYAALGRSHRTNTDAELIHWDTEAAGIQLDFLRLEVGNRLEFQFRQDKRRRILYNGRAIRTKELVGLLNAVLFSPEDIFLIKGSPAGRRRFLDIEISQASPSYYHELVKYTHIVTQRNTLLKRIREHRAKASMLEIWDAQLAESASFLVKKRLEAVKKLNMLANLMQRRISANAENLSISYEIHHQEDNNMTEELLSWYNKKLRESVELDILRGSTSVGPHRDDLMLEVNGINLRSFGSQGQQRTGVLSLKLAELEFLRSETGEYPVLLLDDVMSELDWQRREQLLLFIQKEKIQTLITATDKRYFPSKPIGCYYEVEAGQVSMR